VPKPSDPTQGYTATYDAWNRLIRMEAGADKVAEYEYDGAKRRTVQKTYTAGVLSETRHLYYTKPDQWQVIEERIGTSPDSADAERQFVWGLRYIDDLVLRDRDTDANGSLDERLYAMQDANWNVTAVTNASGTVQERYAYTAYGVPIFLDAAFGSRSSSSYQWETLFAGYRWDGVSKHLFVRNRVYSPMLGVWLQRDPIDVSEGSNLYEYVRSRPIDGFDPNGTTSSFGCEFNCMKCIAKAAVLCTYLCGKIVSGVCGTGTLACIAIATMAAIVPPAGLTIAAWCGAGGGVCATIGGLACLGGGVGAILASPLICALLCAFGKKDFCCEAC